MGRPTYTRGMRVRWGLRSRILALTLPVVLLVSAALAGIVYFALGQVLEASARDVAKAEAVELQSDLAANGIAGLLGDRTVIDGNRLVQLVDPTTDEVLSRSASAPSTPLVSGNLAPREVRMGRLDEVPGKDAGAWVVAAADASDDEDHYTILVAVPTRVESTALGQAVEFAAIGAIGLIAVLGAVTTFAVGQALRPVERMRHQVEATARPVTRTGRPSRCRPGGTS